MLHAEAQPPRHVATVGIVADLRAVADDVERVLALQHLLHEVRHDVAHGELHVARHGLPIRAGPPLADADAVERPGDRVGKPVLFARALCEVLHGELLEAVGGGRRRTPPFLSLLRRVARGVLCLPAADHRLLHRKVARGGGHECALRCPHRSPSCRLRSASASGWSIRGGGRPICLSERLVLVSRPDGCRAFATTIPAAGFRGVPSGSAAAPLAWQMDLDSRLLSAGPFDS